jgi:hypothetical protein
VVGGQDGGHHCTLHMPAMEVRLQGICWSGYGLELLACTRVVKLAIFLHSYELQCLCRLKEYVHRLS